MPLPPQFPNSPDQSFNSSISRVSQFFYDLHNTFHFISTLAHQEELATPSVLPPPIPMHSRPAHHFVSSPDRSEPFLESSIPIASEKSDSAFCSGRRNSESALGSDILVYESNLNEESYPGPHSSTPITLDSRPILLPSTTSIRSQKPLKPQTPSNFNDSDFKYNSSEVSNSSNKEADSLSNNVEQESYNTNHLLSPGAMNQIECDEYSIPVCSLFDQSELYPKTPGSESTLDLNSTHDSNFSLRSISEDSDSDINPSGNDSSSKLHSDNLSYDSEGSQDSYIKGLSPSSTPVLQNQPVKSDSNQSSCKIPSIATLSPRLDSPSVSSAESQSSFILHESTTASVRKKKNLIFSEFNIGIVQESVEEVEELYTKAMKSSAMKYRRKVICEDLCINPDLLDDEKVKELYFKTIQDRALNFKRKWISENEKCDVELMTDEKVEELYHKKSPGWRLILDYQRDWVAKNVDCDVNLLSDDEVKEICDKKTKERLRESVAEDESIDVDLLSDEKVLEIYNKKIMDSALQYRRDSIAEDANINADLLSDEEVEERYSNKITKMVLQYQREVVAEDEKIDADLLSDEEVEELYKQMMERRCAS